MNTKSEAGTGHTKETKVEDSDRNELLELAERREAENSHDGLPQVKGSEAINAETPLGFTGLRVTEIEHTAAGMPAALQTAKFALGEMGLKRSFKTLLKINQNDGFDCMSCAWADPDEHRHLAEFCENGAKAVSDEAMKATITADFFRQYSVAELS